MSEPDSPAPDGEKELTTTGRIVSSELQSDIILNSVWIHIEQAPSRDVRHLFVYLECLKVYSALNGYIFTLSLHICKSHLSLCVTRLFRHTHTHTHSVCP